MEKKVKSQTFFFSCLLTVATVVPSASGAQVRVETEGDSFRAYRDGERTAFAEWRRPGGRFAMDVRTVVDRPFVFVTIRPERASEAWVPGIVSLPAITVSGFRVEPVAMTSGGLRRLGEKMPSCGYLALAEPMTRRGVVVAWLTNLKACGALAFGREDGRIRVTPIADYGPMTVFPDGPQDADTFVIGAFDDCRRGLEAYADAAAERFAIKLPPNRSGYCSWCSDRYGYSDRSEFARGCGAGTESSSCEYATVAAKLLKPYGFDFIQFDDQWQNGEEINGPARDYTKTHPKGGYPNGFVRTVGCINANGFAAGLWFIPFGGCAKEPVWAGKDGLYVKSRVAVEKPVSPARDIGPRMLPRKKGDPINTFWGGECLDLTNPDARAELARTIRRLTHEWGFRYLKCDGIYTGFGCDLCHSGCWCDANFGNAEFRDPSASNVSAYRKGFETIRAAAAPGTFLLGCNLAFVHALVPSFGLVDAMRVGGDNGPIDLYPGRYLDGVEAGSKRYFLNGRVWWSDPDSTYVRAATPLGRARAQATWTSLTDSLFEVGDWLPGLPEERVEILRRTLAHHRLPNVRPIDYFEHAIPNAWIVDGGRQKVFGFFNWHTNGVLHVDYDAAYAGLDAAKTYVGYDFWGKRPFGPFKGRITVDVPSDDCVVLQVAEVPEDDGETLVSASSHVAAPLFLPPEVPGDPVEYRYYSRARGFNVVQRKR